MEPVYSELPPGLQGVAVEDGDDVAPGRPPLHVPAVGHHAVKGHNLLKDQICFRQCYQCECGALVNGKERLVEVLVPLTTRGLWGS